MDDQRNELTLMAKALFLSFLLASVLSANSRAQDSGAIPPPGLLGRWSGASIEKGTPQLFELEFDLGTDGELETTLTLPYNGYDQFSYSFSYEKGDKDGTLTSGLFGDEMRLIVDLDEGHLRGVVTEADSITAHVHLQRVVDFDLPSFSTEEIRFRAGWDTLAGALHLPVGVEKPTTVVLVAGRSYGDRNDTSMWARFLARNGIAAVAFDARGTGASTGENGIVTGEDRFEDVRGLLDELAKRDDLGPVGLLGNSAAGWIVPDIAAEREDVQFVTTFVGPAESLEDQQGHVTTAYMRASGEQFSDLDFREAFEYQRQTVRLAQAGASWAEFAPINEVARSSSWAEHALIPDSLELPDLDYFRRRARFVAPNWSEVSVPVLVVFGESDLIVPPENNVPLLRDALADNPDVTIVVLPGVNHALARPSEWVGQGVWPDRFYRPWTRSPFLFNTLVSWIQDRFGR